MVRCWVIDFYHQRFLGIVRIRRVDTHLGGLCFENPQDIGKLDQRRHVIVTTEELGPLLRDHRIPLVFLEACQTAKAEKASESVASELLKVGVASVVAMSHSVLAETAGRFVEAFYDGLASGARVDDAMLKGRRQLKDDNFRDHVFGEGDLRIFEDEAGKMNRSLLDVKGSALLVSQFTLYGDARGQRRPSFVAAAPAEQAKNVYEEFAEALRRLGSPWRQEFSAQ